VACLRRVFGVQVELAGVTPCDLRAVGSSVPGMTFRFFDSAEDMIDQVDLVDVCSPPYAHESAILAAAEAGKAIICEKPLTGHFGRREPTIVPRADQAAKGPMLEDVITRLRRIADAVRDRGWLLRYAENFVYAPSVQKEREIVEKTGAQILRMTARSRTRGPPRYLWILEAGWRRLMIGKGCHP